MLHWHAAIGLLPACWGPAGPRRLISGTQQRDMRAPPMPTRLSVGLSLLSPSHSSRPFCGPGFGVFKQLSAKEQKQVRPPAGVPRVPQCRDSSWGALVAL